MTKQEITELFDAFMNRFESTIEKAIEKAHTKGVDDGAEMQKELSVYEQGYDKGCADIRVESNAHKATVVELREELKQEKLRHGTGDGSHKPPPTT